MVRKNRKRSQLRLQWVVKTKPDVVPSSPPWIDLPSDITANILGRLDTTDRIRSAYVCTTWRTVCQDYPHMWRVIHLSQSTFRLKPRQLVGMCRKAVYCSQGQLVDITMDGFCTDALLSFIAKRCKCSQLQRLRIVNTCKVSGKVLIKALKKFPMLNELYLFSLWSGRYVFNPDNFDIEAIGRSCPMLNSFTHSYRVEENGIEPDDNVALDVAKSMPGLHHLGLVGNTITKEGVDAILDGCQQLESLDIRLCINATYYNAYNDNLAEDRLERCHRQLKQVWLPRDSCSDHEFYDRSRDFVTWVEGLFERGYSPGYGWCIRYQG